VQGNGAPDGMGKSEGRGAFRRPGLRGIDRRAAFPSDYLTTTVFTADVCDAETWVTRTRILYLPFLAGAFHFSEYLAPERFAEAPLIHLFEVESRLWSVAFTACCGVDAKAPVTATLLPAVAVASALIDSVVLWQRAGVALVRGAARPANSITAPAMTTAASVEMVIVFFILSLRELDRGRVVTRVVTLISVD
jgi:hypothetical protein